MIFDADFDKAEDRAAALSAAQEAGLRTGGVDERRSIQVSTLGCYLRGAGEGDDAQ
ncbi:MAG: hypothetical protein U0359_25415 [Byssovorax sp.]